MERMGVTPQKYILATIHRAENTDDILRLQAIVEGLKTISREIPVVWPVHPRTKALLSRLGILGELPASIKTCAPLGYLDMVQLEKHAALIATDSGGVQKEAFFYKVPCVTFRNETEWTELVDAGWNRLAKPTSGEALVAAMREAIGSVGEDVKPYGDGNAAAQIVSTLAATLS
jgi:UDP-GlcNAc3NAcA epimerase